MESDVNENLFPTKTVEKVDFNLLQYVQNTSNDDDVNKISENMVDSLLSFENEEIVDFSTDYVNSCPIFKDNNVDLLERAVDCPASPFCKSGEIVDYIDNDPSVNISGPSNCEEDVEEPDWLSTWDSL